MSQKSEISISKKNKIFLVLTIGAVSLLLKLYLVDFSVPETGDSWIYILRGLAHSEGDFSQTPFKTSGWPLLLSTFYSFMESNAYIDYLNIARITSIVISTITIIPIYFLGKKFLNEKFSIVMTALFAFQPQLNYNSILGYSESLMIFVLVIAFYLLLNDKINKSVYISFILLGFLWWIRIQGIIFILPFTILYLIYYRKSKNVIKQYLVCLFIFFIVISPIMYERYNEYGNPFYYDGIFGEHAKEIFPSEISPSLIFLEGIRNSFEALGTMLLPYLLFLFPLAFYFSLKLIPSEQKNYIGNWIFLIFSFLPFILFYFSGASASRHLFHLYPFIIILSTMVIKKIIENKKIIFSKENQKIILCFTVGLILLSSILITYGIDEFGYGRPNSQKIHEIQEYGKFLIKNVNGNTLWSKGVDSDWIFVTLLQESEVSLKNYKINPHFDHTFDMIQQFNPGNFYLFHKSHITGNSIEELVINGEKLELKFISISSSNTDKFLDHVYENEKKYPYLIKIFDSDESGFEYYNVKAFKINYDIFSKLNPNLTK